jgi:hypothetical protein
LFFPRSKAGTFLATDETRIERGFLKSFCDGRLGQLAFEFRFRKMKSDIEKENKIPTEIACAYTSAMHTAQQLELKLREILKIADYHEWGSEIATDKQLKRYKNSEQFIDESTLHILIEALKRTRIIKNAEKVWTAFEKARVQRNKLAHKFLIEQTFEHLTKQTKMEIFLSLLEINIVLRRAVVISRRMHGELEKLGENRMKEFC